RLRFEFWSLPMFSIPVLNIKEKILSETATAVVEAAGVTSYGSKDVFIIHGHSESSRTQLKTLLDSFGLNPVILSEQNEGGKTIIENFEYYARLCSFAFALMTPDDQVAGQPGSSPRWRARENVIFEIGWFMARLGRENVI